MLSTVLLAWALVVQVQANLCQDGGCVPHPQVQRRSQVVRTLATESECLLLQIELQRLRQTAVKAPASHRHVQVQTIFRCELQP